MTAGCAGCAVTYKVVQYCYFQVESDTLTVEEITAVVGLEPDESRVYVNRRPEEPEQHGDPLGYAWELVCRQHGRISTQVSDVLARLEPVADAVRELVRSGQVTTRLTFVRYLDDEDGGYDAMGWDLTARQVQLLASLDASIDCDEYFDNHDPDDPERCCGECAD